MASESLVTDQSIDEHAEEKRVGDVSKCVDGEEIIFHPKEAVGKEEADYSKEQGFTGMASAASLSEAKHELYDVPVSDLTKKEVQHEKVGDVGNSLQKSEVSDSLEPAAETNEGNLQSQAYDAHEMPGEVQSVILESKTEDLKDNRIKPKLENERTPEEAPFVSTGVDISEDGNVEAETQEAANPESTKGKGNIELIKSEDFKDEIQVLVPTEIATVVVPDASEVPEKIDIDSGNPASIEVSVKDLEAESGFPEEQKSGESTKTKKPSSNVNIVGAGGEVVESSSCEVKPSEVAEVVEKKDDGLEGETLQTSVKSQDDIEAKPELAQDIDSGNAANLEVPVKDLEVESGFPEEQKSKESTETKDPSLNVSTVDAVGEVVGSSSYELKPSEVAEVVEKNDDGLEAETIQTSVKNQDDIEAKPELVQDIDSDNPANIEVPVKDLEIESVFPEEQKSKERSETKEPSLNVSAVDAGDEVVGSSSYEIKPSEVAEVVDKNVDGFEVVTIQTSVKNQDDIEAKPELAQDQFDNIDTVPKVVEVSFKGGNVLEGNAEAVERDSVDTITDPAEAEVSSDQVKAPTTEVVNEALEVPSKELNIAPEDSEVLSEGDKISAGDEKSESLKGDAATLVEAPNDFTAAEEPLDQVIEMKSAGSVSETHVPSEDKLVDKEKDVNEEAKDINLQSQADGAHETLGAVQSDFTEKFVSQEPTFSESETEDLKDTEIKSTSEDNKKPEEAPLVSTVVGISEDGIVEAEAQEAANPEFSEGKVDIELIKSGDSKDEVQVLVSAETPTVVIPHASEAPEKNDIDSSNLTSIEVPVKYLDVESSPPEEQKSNEITETNGPISNASTVDAGGQVVGSSSHEVKPSEVAEVVEKRDDGLEVDTIQTSFKDQDDIEAKPELAQTQFDAEVSEGAEVKKDDEFIEGGIETSIIPDGIPSLAEVSSEEQKASEPGIMMEVKKDETYLAAENIDTVTKVAEFTLEGGNVLEGDKLVVKEKFVSPEAVERNLVDTCTDSIEAEVFSDKVKALPTTEIVMEALEVTSKELNIAPEASEINFDSDKLSAGTERSESLKGVAATLEAPKDITTAEESLDQVIEEKKSESSASETQAQSEDKLVDEEKDVNEEAKEINLQSQADGADETQRVVQSDFAKTSTSQEPAFSESKTDDLKDTEIKPTSDNDQELVETPLVSTGVDISKDGNVVAETQEETDPEFSKDKVVIELIKSEDSKDATQALVSEEIPTAVVPAASETPEKIDVNSSKHTNIEVPVKDLEVESGSLEEQKSKESTETKEPCSNVSTIDAGGEVVRPSSYEIKPSEVAGVIEKKDDDLEMETIQTSVKSEEDLEAKPEFVQYDENVSHGVEVKKDDEIVEGSIETSTVPDDVLQLAKVSSEEEKVSEPGAVVEEEETSLESDNIDAVPKVAEVPLEGGNVFEGDKLVNKENVVNAEAVEKDFVDMFDQLKAPTTTEIEKEALEVTSVELNFAPEASEAPAEIDKVSVGDEEKSECLKGGAAISFEEPKYIIAVNEPLDQLVEERKSVSSVSETAASAENKVVDKEKYVNVEDDEKDLVNTSTDPSTVEVFSEQLKAPEESNKKALEDTSKELNLASEASEIPSDGDKLSVGEEKREILEGEAATSVEALKDITTTEKSLDQVIEEKKSKSSTSETQAPSEDKLVIDNEKDVNEEAKEINWQIQADGADETISVVQSNFIETTVFKEPLLSEFKTEDLEDTEIKPSENENKPEEASLVSTGVDISEDRNVENEIQAANPEFSKDKVPSEVDTFSSGDKEKSESLIVGEATSVEAPKDIISAKESLDQLAEEKKSDISAREKAAPIVDKLVVEEKNVNVVDEESDLINTSTDAAAAKLSSEQVKASEIVEEESDKQTLEETFKELNIASEASEVPSEDDKLSAGEDKSGLNGEATTLVEAPKVITTVEDSLDQGIEEKKSESSINEMEAQAEDRLVDNERNVNEEAKGRELVTAAEISSDQVKASETAKIIKEESNKQVLEMTSKELSIASEASEVPSEGNEVSAGEEKKRESLKREDATLVEAPKDITIAEESHAQVAKLKKNEGSKSEMEALAEDKLVDEEKDVNAETKKIDLVDTSTDPSADEVFSEQAKVSETSDNVKESDKEVLESTSKELNVVPEASEVPSNGDKFSTDEEKKSETLKGEDATSLGAPKDFTAAEKSIDQLIEENKSESSNNETEAPIETTRDFDTSKLFPEAVKDIIASETVEENQNVTSKDFSVEENESKDSADKEEVETEEVLQNAIGKPEKEALGAEKAESEKSKDQDPIVSSDSGGATLTKEVTKRESNIFSKVKRSIVKAKKAILGKSPGPKTLSSEAKYENT